MTILNSIRDVVVATDTSLVPNVERVIYTVPAIYDLYLTKITCSIILPNGSNAFINIFNKARGESDALFMTAGTGRSELDWSSNPMIFPPTTNFSIYIAQVTGPITYQNTQIWGILQPTNPNFWN